MHICVYVCICIHLYLPLFATICRHSFLLLSDLSFPGWPSKLTVEMIHILFCDFIAMAVPWPCHGIAMALLPDVLMEA